MIANGAIIETINVSNTNVGPVIILQNEPEICNIKKGSALLVPGNLDYNWSDGGTGSFREDLPSGDYLVTATIPGNNNCMDILTVSIGLESSLNLSHQVNQYPDCGESNGSVTIIAEGGSGNYSYSWGAATHNNLPKGTFNILVTDNVTGCSDTYQFTLIENVAGVAIHIDSIKNVSCSGFANGKIDYQLIETGDFAGPAEIIITNGFGKNFDGNALPAGNYCLIAKDANGCYAGESCFEITQPERLLVEVTVIPKTCNVENTILINSSGGNGLYTYNWADQDGEINPRDRRGIENGTYSVTVTDAAGCNIPIENIIINGECFRCALAVTASIETIPECGMPNGAATIKVNNFFGNLSYSWGADSIRTDLLAGAYIVTVTDDYRGCDTTVSFTLTEPELPSEATIAELIVCPNETGQLDYDLSNFRCFSQPLSVVITDESGKIYDEDALPANGNYIFIVKDADGAELNRQYFSVEAYQQIIANSAITNEGCTTKGAIDLELTNSENNYSIQWGDLTGENQPVDRTELNEGTYSVTITSNAAGACSVTHLFNVIKKTGIVAEIEPVTLTCDLSPVQLNLDGIDIVTYEWSPAVLIVDGQGTANPTVISDGPDATIQVTATNSFGCSIEKEVKIIAVPTVPPTDISSSPQCEGLTVKLF